MRGLKVLSIAACIGFVGLLPGTAAAQTISVSQTITITARVAPARSIIVNEQGRMVKIFSNTDQPVTPKVYTNVVSNSPLPLTPLLQTQYYEIMSQQKKVIGVEIPVEPPRGSERSVKNLLFGSISTILMKF